MIGNVGAALKRKFGPLPAWAWAGIGLVAVLFYRRFKGQQGGVTSPISPVGELQSDQPHPDPTVLQPGERVYDNGKVYGDQPPDPTSGPPDPPVPDPYPGPINPPIPPHGHKTPPKHKPPKRKPKLKVKPLHRPVPHPQHGRKVTASGWGAMIKNIRKKPSRAAVKSAHPPLGKPKGRGVKPTAKPPGRGRATMPPQAALRQRPTPPRVMDHEQQKIVPAHGGAAHSRAKPPPPHKKK